MKIIQIRKLTKIKFDRYIYETTMNQENAEKNALAWAKYHGVNSLYKFDMGHGTKWIISTEECK